MDLGDIAQQMEIPTRDVTPLLNDAIKWLLGENRRLASKAAPKPVKSALELALLRKFRHLKDVFVVPGGPITKSHEYDALVSRWGSWMAAYLDRRADAAAASGSEIHVCMSGGETIFEFVNRLPIRERENVFFYASALIGRGHQHETSHVDAIANVTIAWSRSGRIDGRCTYATVTPYDLSISASSYKESRERVVEGINELSGLDPIRDYLKVDLAKVNIAIAGIGMIDPLDTPAMRKNRITATSLLKSTAWIDKKDLLADKALGEIGYCYFDKNGVGDNEKWRFYLTAGDHVPSLRGVKFYNNMVTKKKEDVIVSAGAFKIPAIQAALKGKLFNVWFTNEDAARTILYPNGRPSPVTK